MAFDFRTQRMNKKGQVTSKTPYRLFIDKGVQKFERPPKSGVFYNADGSLIPSEPKVMAKEAPKKSNEKKSYAKEPEVEVDQKEKDELKADLLLEGSQEDV